VGATFALLLAAGSGTRMGRPAKALMDLGGVPMFLHAYRSLASWPDLAGVVILVPEPNIEAASACLESEPASARTVIAAGGETRQASVRRGLEVLPQTADSILCHDAARPFASPSLVARVMIRLLGPGAADVDGVVPILSSADTVKRVRDGLVVETIPREELGLVQTPQAFRRAALEAAHARAAGSGLVGTDDAVLLEAAGYRVGVVPGEEANFKITTPADLRRAEDILARQDTA
jgi:2-C-methyl-D-erythritol 4-phosphate cytidylyltransferase/2-C-methyl-D-erythritol 2,4-cyclodiphosphate synthase